jgi:hypothetical protein
MANVIPNNLLGQRRPRTAFTLMEVLIATMVFSLFLGGVFSLYSMGTGMYQAGSWKLQKQKEAERFLALLKERLEQASHAAVVTPPAGPELTETPSHLGFVNGPITRTTLGSDPKRVILFTICKPSIGAIPGVLLYHGVRARPTPNTTNLMNLEFLSTTNVNHAFLVGTPFTFFPSGAPTLTRFNQATSPTLGSLRLGGDPDMAVVSEIASFSITRGTATDGLLSIEFLFRHPNPKLHKTVVTHRTVARIQVPLTQKNLGEL